MPTKWSWALVVAHRAENQFLFELKTSATSLPEDKGANPRTLEQIEGKFHSSFNRAFACSTGMLPITVNV